MHVCEYCGLLERLERILPEKGEGDEGQLKNFKKNNPPPQPLVILHFEGLGKKIN